MGARFLEAPGGDFDPRQMDINAFAFGLVVGGLERVRPRGQRVVGAQRADAVIAFRVIGREREIVRIEPDGLLVQRERLVKDLLFVDMVKCRRVPAIQINDEGEILIINRFVGVQRNGPVKTGKGVGYRAVLAVIVGEIVPGGRILWIKLRRAVSNSFAADSSSLMSFRKVP